MIIKWIHPNRLHGIKYDFPPCCADRKTMYYSENQGKQYKCSRRATIDIDGLSYCNQHGGAIALEHIIAISDKVSMPTFPKIPALGAHEPMDDCDSGIEGIPDGCVLFKCNKAPLIHSPPYIICPNCLASYGLIADNPDHQSA